MRIPKGLLGPVIADRKVPGITKSVDVEGGPS
jgi:hypothetical protein